MYTITFSLEKHGNDKLTENFSVREFRCKDGSDKIIICPETVNILQSVRWYFGKSVTINSAYRTPSHNKVVGGATNSQHVVGTACDIKINGIPPKAIASYLEARFPDHGIGLYSTFVHVDSRGYAKYWDQRSGTQKVVRSFGLGKIYEAYDGNNEKGDELELTVPELKKALLSDGDFCRKVAEKYIAELNAKPVSSWAAEDWEFAKSNGFVDGTKPCTFATREQTVSIIKRMLDK